MLKTAIPKAVEQPATVPDRGSAEDISVLSFEQDRGCVGSPGQRWPSP